ncbi:hypothetical protein BDV11DRAFT_182634 [Aspergillus similis]
MSIDTPNYAEESARTRDKADLVTILSFIRDWAWRSGCAGIVTHSSPRLIPTL